VPVTAVQAPSTNVDVTPNLARRGTLRALLVSLRPHQWTKNLIVFAALAFSKHLFEPRPLLRTVVAFVVFCGVSGTVYLLNDLADVERDRLHPRKRLRPLASGEISQRFAATVGFLIGATCLSAAFVLGWEFGLCAVVYLAMNLTYTLYLKEVVILDVLTISLGFVVRAVAGGLVIAVHISDWLLVCTILLALFLALSKRRHELVSLSDTASSHRAILGEYSPYLLDQMIGVVTASCLTAYAFYTLSAETVTKYQTNKLSWTIPFVIYGIFRYLYLVHQKEKGGSPSDVLLTDRPLLLAVLLWAITVVLVVYTAPGAPVPMARP
jgi:4-hydroxybenzoate polyprenyltransferase